MAGAGFAILVIGILTVISFAKGNYNEVATQVENDMFGTGSGSGFLLWVAAIVFLAVMGSALHIPRAAKMFMVLVLVVYIISQNGLWTQAETAFATATAPAASSATTAGVGQAETATGVPVTATTTTAASGAANQSSGPAVGAITGTSAPSWVPSFMKGLWQ